MMKENPLLILEALGQSPTFEVLFSHTFTRAI
jgi:hypothetical protein